MHRPCVRCQQGRRVQRNTQQRQRFSNICRVGFHMVRCPQQEHCSGLQGLHCQAASHTAARVAVEIRRRGQTSQPQEQLQQPGQPPRACCFWRPQRRRLQLHQRKSHDCQAQPAHPPEGFHVVQVQASARGPASQMQETQRGQERSRLSKHGPALKCLNTHDVTVCCCKLPDCCSRQPATKRSFQTSPWPAEFAIAAVVLLLMVCWHARAITAIFKGAVQLLSS